MSKSPFILYVGKDIENSAEFCCGSKVCINMLQGIENEHVTIQDANVLMNARQLPDWLDGTPVLVDTTAMSIYKGSDAIRELSTVVSKAGHEKAEKVSVEKNGAQLTTQTASEDELSSAFSIDSEAQKEAEKVVDDKVSEADIQKLMQQRNKLLPVTA